MIIPKGGGVKEVPTTKGDPPPGLEGGGGIGGKRSRNGEGGSTTANGGQGDNNNVNNNGVGGKGGVGDNGAFYQTGFSKGGGVTREEMCGFVMGLAQSYKGGGKGKGVNGGEFLQYLDERQFRRVEIQGRQGIVSRMDL